MMDWFKMQTVWGASVERLSDAEAGRFIKAMYAYVRDGVEYEGSSGREDPTIWLALEALRGDIESFKQKEANQKEHEEALKEKRREAAQARWAKQNGASACKEMQVHASASDVEVCIASASENKNKNKDNNNIIKPPIPPLFADFWKAYPKHQDKQGALKAFQKLKPDQELLDQMIKSINAWKQSEQWTKDGGQYIPMPTTWLNRRRWEDDLPQTAQFKPIKTVSAQQYTQRDYDEDDLEERLGVNDLFRKGAS